MIRGIAPCRLALTASVCAGLVLSGCAREEPEPSIEPGSLVTVEYTVRLDDDTVVNSNVGGEPWTFEVGQGQIVPGLEQELLGMASGQETRVVVRPEAAYGPVLSEAFREVPKDRIPANALRTGAEIQIEVEPGRRLKGRVSEIRDESVVVDFNHPLAGKTLQFDVKILDVEAPARS